VRVLLNSAPGVAGPGPEAGQEPRIGPRPGPEERLELGVVRTSGKLDLSPVGLARRPFPRLAQLFVGLVLYA